MELRRDGSDVSTTSERRPTKAERGAATRARLLDATVECLVELGWSGTSTTEVVRRAGVSRGAQVHHFPTKEDLVLAAVEHLCTRRMDEYRKAFEALPAPERTTDASLDLLRSLYAGPAVDAWLELALAARTDPVLHERFVAFERRFFAASLALFQETFPEVDADPAGARLALRLTFCLLDGLAVGRVIGTDPAELDAVMDAYKVLIAPFSFPQTRSDPP
jgi:AcrR family transcriptional regulator